MNNGFLKISLITPKLEVGNPKFNINEMILALKDNTSSIAVFPELGISGYSCGDIFFQKSIFDDTLEALQLFLTANPYEGVSIVGAPLIVQEMVLNCAVVVQKNKILGVVPKFYLPNTKEYYEKRWFKSGFDVVDHITEIQLLDQIQKMKI